VWLWVLAAVGVAGLAYTFALQIARPVSDVPAEGLVWPLLGVTPLLGVGLFFTAFSDNREGSYILIAGSVMGLGSAVETHLGVYPEILSSPRFALVSSLMVGIDVVASLGWTSAIATFPDGHLDSSRQRVLLRLSWLGLLGVPILLFASPTVYTSGWTDLPDGLPNPYAVPELEGLAPWGRSLLLLPLVGIVVFVWRALFGSLETRRRLRVLALTLVAAAVGFTLWGLALVLDLPETNALVTIISITIYASMIAIPVAFVHGVFRYGAFGVRTSRRATAAMRSSSLLIGLVYACAVAAPAVLLAQELMLGQAIIITVAMALLLQPLRSRAEAFVRRNVLGDRDRELTLLVQLGAQLEQTVGLDSILDELAAAIRDGLRASWTRIRLLDEEGVWSKVLQGRAGLVTGPPVESRDLVRAGRRIGRIDLGPRRSGRYAPFELDLLTTVSGQAATAVANVALAAQLEQRLVELSASRARLVVAQDDERRRIERDLHDGIQQNVVALIAGLRLARNRLERGELDAEELVALQEQARETLVDLREIAHGIHPPVLGDNGLVAAVESRVARFPVPLDVVADASLRRTRFSADLEAAAYYVVSESLANIVKHADASQARVALGRENGWLTITVSDDGRGLDATALPDHGGLSNIRDRVAAAGGRISVSGLRRGTEVSVRIPVGSSSAADASDPGAEPVKAGARHG
jgi:signal transduction histidine kinase